MKHAGGQFLPIQQDNLVLLRIVWNAITKYGKGPFDLLFKVSTDHDVHNIKPVKHCEVLELWGTLWTHWGTKCTQTIMHRYIHFGLSYRSWELHKTSRELTPIRAWDQFTKMYCWKCPHLPLKQIFANHPPLGRRGQFTKMFLLDITWNTYIST